MGGYFAADYRGQGARAAADYSWRLDMRIIHAISTQLRDSFEKLSGNPGIHFSRPGSASAALRHGAGFSGASLAFLLAGLTLWLRAGVFPHAFFQQSGGGSIDGGLCASIYQMDE